MTHTYTLFSIIICFAVLIRYLNYKYINIQPTIAITIGSFTLSLLLMLLHHFHLINIMRFTQTVSSIDFQALLLNGMLGLFLFAGALSIDLKALKKYQWEIASLAFFGVIASTFLIASGLYLLLHALNVNLNFIYCLVFGAIISPTDPIAVLGTMKEVKASKELTTKIAGESLFNDGVGLVLFVTLYQVAFSSTAFSLMDTFLLFFQEAIGGIVYGLAIGAIAYYLIKNVQNAKLEILITVCIATAGYIFAQNLHISGPLAMVVSGLIVGNTIREHGFTDKGKQHLDIFWELIDELLNAILFLLIGFEVLILKLNLTMLIGAISCIVIVLFARLIIVALPMNYFKQRNTYSPYVITILTWGGLRGGLAIAMALSLPSGDIRDTLLTSTYGVALFSIIVQGLTIKPLVNLSKKA